MSRPVTVLGLLAVGALVGAAGCSNSSAALTTTGAAAIRPLVVAVRDAAATGDRDTLQAAIHRLQAKVAKEENSGAITTDRGTDIDNEATLLLDDFDATTSPTPTPTPSATTITPTPTPTTPTPTTTSPSPTPSQSSPPAGPPSHPGGPPTATKTPPKL
jgi:hypothetical protein